MVHLQTSSNANLKKLQSVDLSLHVEANTIARVDAVRDLGAILDGELTMTRLVTVQQCSPNNQTMSPGSRHKCVKERCRRHLSAHLFLIGLCECSDRLPYLSLTISTSEKFPPAIR